MTRCRMLSILPLSLLLPLLLLLLLVDQTATAGHGYSFPKGRLQPCSNEGERFELSFLKNPCITCKCEGGAVICDRERCPESDRCHLVLRGQPMRPGSCCHRCKGCHTPQGDYDEDEEWSDPRHPCQVSRCVSGVITRATVQCHTPCSDPLPPAEGQCCPRCPAPSCADADAASANVTSPLTGQSSALTGQSAAAAAVALAAAGDPCVRCVCGLDGGQSCAREVCPTLSCPEARRVWEPGQCCPQCKGMHRVAADAEGCRHEDTVHPPGADFTVDACTRCTCQGSTAVCHRRSCAPLDCPRRLHLHLPGECCPVCRPPERVRRQCRRGRRLYQDGETWQLSACSTCNCTDGQISCVMERCAAAGAEPPCPPGHSRAPLPGHCCRQCVENDAVCTVFGDPHYSSFDGRLFNYQGTCRYVLAKDCADRSFAVRVRNEPRNSRFFSWTRSASVKVGDMRIALRQNRRVKVDGQQVKLPYLRLGQAAIYQDPADNFNVVVKLIDIGVRVTWDGEGFLQVRVPPAYKSKMCGLCGDYNGRRVDDFRTKSGRVTRSVRRFGLSWRVGGRRQCAARGRRGTRRHRQRARAACGRDRRRRRRAARQCRRLREGAFTACHARLGPQPFFRSCVQDMCECAEGESCYCEALTAYSHACRRKGVEVDWLNGTSCAAHGLCPRGATYEQCRSPCQPSCAAPVVPAACLSAGLQCQPGCVCPEGTLLHRGLCVPPQLCPNR